MAKRLSRFLIDKVDERLGDVEKEKKFDIYMIILGIVILLAGICILVFRSLSGPIAAIAILITLAGFVFTYTMIKEYIADCAKAKTQKHIQ